MPAILDRPKKESYETAFEAFLAEAKKNEDEKVKAEEKKVSKPVEEDLDHIFDRKDDKNPDNLIFDQIMTGYYAEMKDPKNADKTMQELKDIVFKNLAKDPIMSVFFKDADELADSGLRLHAGTTYITSTSDVRLPYPQIEIVDTTGGTGAGSGSAAAVDPAIKSFTQALATRCGVRSLCGSAFQSKPSAVKNCP